jgi:hypothetical protein
VTGSISIPVGISAIRSSSAVVAIALSSPG